MKSCENCVKPDDCPVWKSCDLWDSYCSDWEEESPEPCPICGKPMQSTVILYSVEWLCRECRFMVKRKSAQEPT